MYFSDVPVFVRSWLTCCKGSPQLAGNAHIRRGVSNSWLSAYLLWYKFTVDETGSIEFDIPMKRVDGFFEGQECPHAEGISNSRFRIYFTVNS